ncbi:Crp/Fnr family transcriptional regulator [Nocardioides marmotae]|uniref:Crp/Fnr family transcriptional regulator n=1 Tax=Nocardioides marmotae TaxID=2663857 RepID=UPI001495B5FA|nr:Crp/Fnr family transcriptional regulator [Nocardioides marmotae]QKE00609.1 Crp/Fnr family transcriptional regulator [Nocardioides marmotae]
MDWPLLGSLSETERRAVMAATATRRWPRGDFLFHEDDPADTMHLVVSGHLAVRTFTAEGGAALLNVLGPGDVIGELSLLPGSLLPGAAGTRSASVVCLDPVVTQVLTATTFAEICDAHPGVERWLAGLLARRVRELSARVRDLMHVSIEERVRSGLRDLASRFADQGGARPVVPLTQDQVAEFVGATRPTVNLVLQQLAAEGVVRLGRGRLDVIDAEAL